ncbi:MAG: hypothetical protein Q7R92_00670 [bacterium]|nr:hypothetical protein [bacterium]
MAQTENLDSKLMNNTLSQEQEPDAAAELRQRQRGAGGEPEGERQAEEQGGQPRSWRERIMAKRRVLDLKKRAEEELEKKVMAPVRAATTNRALQWAWTTLIPSWGLTLIYINMHVFLRWVFPSAFCKLGEEWVPKVVAAESSTKNVAGTAFGIVEMIGLVILDLLVFFIIIGIISLLVWLADNLVFRVVYQGAKIISSGWELITGQ